MTEEEFLKLEIVPYGVIYLAFNCITNKSYIGKSNNYVRRKYWHHHHFKKGEKNILFQRALRKYGWDSFYWTILDIGKSFDDLNDREKKWIYLFDSNNTQKGYNLTRGGDGGNVWESKSEEEKNLFKEKMSYISYTSKTQKSKEKQRKTWELKTKEEIDDIKNRERETKKNKTKEEKEVTLQKFRDTMSKKSNEDIRKYNDKRRKTLSNKSEEEKKLMSEEIRIRHLGKKENSTVTKNRMQSKKETTDYKKYARDHHIHFLCIDTGQIFFHIKDAVEAIYRDYKSAGSRSIFHSIKYEKPVLGYSWREVRDN
jgi:group I intron endonuclease